VELPVTVIIHQIMAMVFSYRDGEIWKPDAVIFFVDQIKANVTILKGF